MRDARRLLGTVLVLALLAGFAPAAAQSDWVDTSPFEKEPPYVIGLSNISVVNAWRVAMVEEFKAEAARHPDLISDVYITDAGGNIAKQISDVEDLIARGIDALLITATSPTALGPVVARAVAQGIPVVTFDNVVLSDQVTVTLLADQRELGGSMAQALVDHLGGHGKIVALGGIAGTSSGENRWAGAKAVFDRYPGIEVVGQAWVDWAYDKAKRATENFIAAHPDLDAIWTDGGGSADGALQALIENDYRVIPVTGTASNGFLKKWVGLMPEGFVGFSTTEPPYDSAVALQLALKVLQGEQVRRVEPMPLVYINNDNVEEFVRPDIANEFIPTTQLPEEVIQSLWGSR